MRQCKIKILCTSQLLTKPIKVHYCSLLSCFCFSNSFGIPEHNNTAFCDWVCPSGFPWSGGDAELFLLIHPGGLSPHPTGEWGYCLCSEMGQAASHAHVHLLGKLCLPRGSGTFLRLSQTCWSTSSLRPRPSPSLDASSNSISFFPWVQQNVYSCRSWLMIDTSPSVAHYITPPSWLGSSVWSWSLFAGWVDFSAIQSPLSSSPNFPSVDPTSWTTLCLTQAHCSHWPASLLLPLSLYATPSTPWLSLSPSFPSWDLTLWYSELCFVFLLVLVELKLSPHVGPT